MQIMAGSDSTFKGGDVVWVKCGALFWPAQVLDFADLPKDVRDDFGDNPKPKTIAKFFNFSRIRR